MCSQNKWGSLQSVVLSWGEAFLLNHVLTRSRHILHRTGRKQQQGLCKKKKKKEKRTKNEQLQLLRKQSMPISHYSTSTSTFFKGINLKLKWKTSCFRSAPKIFERQLLNQNTAPSFFLSFPLLCWGFLNDSAVGLHQGCLQGCAILSFNLPLLRLSSVRHASMISMENEAHDINLACFFLKDMRINVKSTDYLLNKKIFSLCNVQLHIFLNNVI